MNRDKGNNVTCAWTDYWSQRGKPSAGCLPDLPPDVSSCLLAIWDTFFASLSPGSQLLDLGTGTGSLLVRARVSRPDLGLTGVDYSANLPDLGPGITMHPETRMEELPFKDRSFNVVTGQFAIEYGNLPEILGELKRVLAPEGRVLFLCHHAEGIIVRDNCERLAALQGMLGYGGLVETAIKLVRKRKTERIVLQQKLARAFSMAVMKYNGQSAVHEVGADVAGIVAEPDSLKKLLLLRRAVEMECFRLEALKKAALTENSARELASLLGKDGQPIQIDVMRVPGTGLPLAWRIGN